MITTQNICATCGEDNSSEKVVCLYCGARLFHFKPPSSALAKRIASASPQESNVTTSTSGEAFHEQEVIGTNGCLQLYASKVRIVRKGFLVNRTDKDILLTAITSIELQKCSFIENGYFQIAFMGGTEINLTRADVFRDENTVLFNGKQQDKFLLFRDNLEQQRIRVLTPLPAPLVSKEHHSSLDDLERLVSFRDRGIITDEEFEIKKKQILGI